MSINGHIREISPALLRRIQDDPSLTRTIILGSIPRIPGFDAAREHYDRLESNQPSREKDALAAALEHMSPAQRQMALLVVDKIGGFFRKAYSQVGDLSELEPGSLGEHLGLGQAWHGLHFLLSGSPEPTPTPLGQAVLGGIEIGEDTGYGPPRYLDAAAVKGIANALAAVDATTMRGRFDGDAMSDADLYLDAWTEPGIVDWLMQEFDRLREFYVGAAARGNAALLYHI